MEAREGLPLRRRNIFKDMGMHIAKIVSLVVLAMVGAGVHQASAQPILLQRCNTDSLDPTAAAARIEWARRCGLTTHVGNPNGGFDTGVPAANGGNLYEYLETDENTNPNGQNTYTGPAYAFEINSAFVNSLFLSGVISQITDALGYKKWERAATRKRPRPLYPTFGSTANLLDPTNVQLKPSANTNDCRLYNAQGAIAATYFVNGYCEASCYAPDQRVLFAGGEMSILDALNQRRDDVVTLAPGSTLDSLKLIANKTYSYTAETRDSTHLMIEVATASGGTLRVTEEHPVINGEGRIVQARTLKVGDNLVRSSGKQDPIVKVTRSTHYGKVYNLAPATEDLVANVLVAQGFLVGSSRYQNDDVGYMNRVILFGSVPTTAIP